MKNLVLCLVGLALVFRVQGQNDYYSKPAPKRITAYVGINNQTLSSYTKYATSEVRGEIYHLQLGAIYDLPIWGKFSISPELAIRQNGATLTYKSPLLYTYEVQVKGFSTQFLLPVKYTFQIGKAGSIGISGGLFVELPIDVQVTEDIIRWNPNDPNDRLPINHSAIHGLAKGWQLAAVYTVTPFQIRLYLANRGAIEQTVTHLPSTRVTGFTLGFCF